MRDVVELPDGRRLYHAGDTSVFSDMQLIRELYSPELAMLPIGDLFTMSPREAALACRLLQPKKVIPMHFGTFQLTPEGIDEPPRELATALQERAVPAAWFRTVQVGESMSISGVPVRRSNKGGSNAEVHDDS